MLKIKDDVSIEELAKFGFYIVDWNPVTKPYFMLENINVEMGIGRTKHDIWATEYEEAVDWNKYQDLLYDLIKADLVEKVEK